MIITLVCDVLGGENNGTTIATMNLKRFLEKQGHTVKILCADQSKIGLENYYVVPNLNFGNVLNGYVSKVGISLAKPKEEILREAFQNSDIVHIMLPLTLAMKSVKVANEMNIPITAGFHMQAENFTSYVKLYNFKALNKVVYKFIYKHTYQYAKAIHYPTKFIKDIFEKNIKKSTNGYVISNGVNTYVKKKEIEKPEEFKDKIVILSIGRYAREKSQDTLLKAVKYSKYKDKLQLIFAGQGVKEKYYKKLAKSLLVKPIFHLYSRDEIIDVLNYADMYVHPADGELEGIACLEAITCGKLTIVSDSKLSATKDFAIDKKCIFKHRNPKHLASIIDYWIEHPDEKKIYEEKYANNACCFNQEECMKQMEQMLLKVIDEKKER